jgi:hypothetical protein
MRKAKLKLKQKLIKMFTESTGEHFLDSGDHLGRHWQINQAVPFKEWGTKPDVEYEVESEYPVQLFFTVELFNFFWEMFAEIDSEVNTLQEILDNMWKHYLEIGYFEARNQFLKRYSDGSYQVVNTYNEESLTTQTFEYAFIDEDKVIIMLHNGADARGGYTAPRIFKFANFEFSDRPFFQIGVIIDGDCECPEVHYFEYGIPKVPERIYASTIKNTVTCVKCHKTLRFRVSETFDWW